MPIIFLDMRQREADFRQTLQNRVDQLNAQLKRDGVLDTALQNELNADLALLTPGPTSDKPRVLDPLFKAVQDAFKKTNQPVGDHFKGALPSQINYQDDLTSDEAALAAAFGIMEREGQSNPVGQRFFQTLALARGEYNANPDLYDNVLGILVKQGAVRVPNNVWDQIRAWGSIQPQGGGTAAGGSAIPPVGTLLSTHQWNFGFNLMTGYPGPDPALIGQGDGDALITFETYRAALTPLAFLYQVDAGQWAFVVQQLIAQGVSADDFHLDVKTLFALAGQEGVNDNGPASAIAIDLPDLDSQTNVEIVTNNIIAMQGLHFASMFEELKAFAVVDKLVEQFTLGQLPLGRGNAGNGLYNYWKKSINRLTEIERRNLYARAFGTPGGDPSAGSPNGEFSDLWIRFISTVSAFARQLTIDDLFRTQSPASVNQEQVKKSGRDLAGNLSLHGYGMAYFAATELQTQIREIITLLGDDEIMTAYGAKDMFGVIDQVATLELGGAKNSVKYRTMATSGATIIKWIADHASDLTASSQFSILNLNAIRNPPPRAAGQKPTTNPTDRDLVDACESWLAVTGTQDTSVQQYAQPTEPPLYTSSPIRIPAVARDLLDSVGVKPMSYINGKSKSQIA